jgi:hypothetical protein
MKRSCADDEQNLNNDKEGLREDTCSKRETQLKKENVNNDDNEIESLRMLEAENSKHPKTSQIWVIYNVEYANYEEFNNGEINGVEIVGVYSSQQKAKEVVKDKIETYILELVNGSLFHTCGQSLNNMIEKYFDKNKEDKENEYKFKTKSNINHYEMYNEFTNSQFLLCYERFFIKRCILDE